MHAVQNFFMVFNEMILCTLISAVLFPFVRDRYREKQYSLFKGYLNIVAYPYLKRQGYIYCNVNDYFKTKVKY